MEMRAVFALGLFLLGVFLFGCLNPQASDGSATPVPTAFATLGASATPVLLEGTLGGFCGGIAGIKCNEGLACQYQEPLEVSDRGGKCIEPPSSLVGKCGASSDGIQISCKEGLRCKVESGSDLGTCVEKAIACPLYTPMTPEAEAACLDAGGTFVETELDENDCPLPPKCVGANASTASPTPVPSPSVQASVQTVEVKIQGFAFSEKEITINKGDSVKWTNFDSVRHNAVSTSAPSGSDFSTQLLANGESASVVFNTPGVYEYKCGPHPYMTGKITVR